jgi:hypothetical protein
MMQSTIDRKLAGMDPGHWYAHLLLERYEEDVLPQDPRERALIRPYDVFESEGNVLVNGDNTATQGGVRGMWDRLIGNTTVVAYSNANARIGVGDGNGSVPTGANADTDLTAPTNKLRKAMNATYPQLGASPARSLIFQSDFTTSEANFAWREWGIFNTATAAQGMLNHKGEDLGTKVSGTWTLTLTLAIS